MNREGMGCYKLLSKFISSSEVSVFNSNLLFFLNIKYSIAMFTILGLLCGP